MRLKKIQKEVLKAAKTALENGSLYNVSLNFGSDFIDTIEYPVWGWKGFKRVYDYKDIYFLETQNDGYHVVRDLSNLSELECKTVIEVLNAAITAVR